MLVHTGCLPTHLTALPTGTAVATGTLLLGNDAQYHAATVTAIQKEGAAVQAAPTFLNFVGAGVTAALSGAGATVTIPQSFTPVQDEGVVVQATPTAINFVGAGVTATTVGSVATVTIPSGGGAVPVQEEGVTVQAAPTAINFVGAGVTATTVGTVATVTIPQSFLPIQEEGVAVQATPTFLNFIGSGVTAAASGAGATVTIVGASGPVQEEGVQVVASPTFTNFAGTALTATASGAGALVTIDPYATNAIAQAGTSVRDIITAANLFARENVTAQVGLSNDVTTIPAPTAGLSNWGTNLLGERLHYMPGIGWKIVADFSGASAVQVGVTVTAASVFTVAGAATLTMPRAGRVIITGHVNINSTVHNQIAGGISVNAVQKNNSNLDKIGPAATLATLGGGASTHAIASGNIVSTWTGLVAAGDVIAIRGITVGATGQLDLGNIEYTYLS